ncbi:MAG: DUF1385 domain-containing protein [Chloroflexi bacterium]|nr:MAG: DUF1385 domain-containing protein [Chloroflexota bacterium]
MSFSYGGQAVIEGVMMRGAHNAAIAVRNPKGEIVVHEQPLNATLYRGRISKTPFLRGLVLLWDALGLGMRALLWSADVAIGEDEDVNFNGPIGWATVAFSLVFGIGLFFILPTLAATGLESVLGLTEESFLVNLLEGFVRLLLVIGYIWVIGFMPDVKRLFGYHGAEHKTINAYEAGADLTPDVVAQYPIEHPRCGTAFLLNVVLVSVLVFSVLGRPDWWVLLLSRVLLIPVIAGISYEWLKFTAANLNNKFIRWLIVPNLALQHLTTNQPDEGMIEVAIVAFKRVLLSEGLLHEEDAAIPDPKPEFVSPTFAAGD